LAASPGVIISLIVSPFEVERSRVCAVCALFLGRVENRQRVGLGIVLALSRE